MNNKGQIYFRKDKNEVNPYGLSWKMLEVEDISLMKDKRNKIMNIWVTPMDVYLITYNGMVLILENINKPRLYDI